MLLEIECFSRSKKKEKFFPLTLPVDDSSFSMSILPEVGVFDKLRFEVLRDVLDALNRFAKKKKKNLLPI